jgi:hypothetical protein
MSKKKTKMSKKKTPAASGGKTGSFAAMGTALV